MDKRFLLILTALAVAFGGVFWFNKSNSSDKTGGGLKDTVSNHVSSTESKPVTLVEYGDYQCPACGQFYPIVKQLKSQYANDVNFRFANFPLIQIHPNAMVSARAAEAASLQGKFWEMHDLLFENQSSWSSSSNPTPIFEQYAKSLGLDVTKFKKDLASSAVLATINADTSQAQALGATATPTFVLNGEVIKTNPSSIEAFSKLIDEAIKKAKQ